MADAKIRTRIAELARLHSEWPEEGDASAPEAALRLIELFDLLDTEGFDTSRLNVFEDGESGYELQRQTSTYIYTATVPPSGPFRFREVEIRGPRSHHYTADNIRALASALAFRRSEPELRIKEYA